MAENVAPTEVAPLSADEKRSFASRSLVALLIVVSWAVAIFARFAVDADHPLARYAMFGWLLGSWALLYAIYRCPRCRGYLGSAKAGRFCPKCRVQLRGEP